MDGSGFIGDAGAAQTLAQMAYSMEVAEMDMPHVVVTQASGYQTLTLSGPYPSGMAALVAADFECGNDRQFGAGDLSFHVAPLYPPLELTSGDASDLAGARRPVRSRSTATARSSSVSHLVCRSSRRRVGAAFRSGGSPVSHPRGRR